MQCRTMCVASVLVTLLLGTSASLSFDAEAAKNRPVTKVIDLLKDMKKQLEAEGEEDEKVFDRMACWCETNDKEKTKAIADAEARLEDLAAKVESYTATSARLGTEIDNLKDELAKNQQALDQATEIRSKEAKDFSGAEVDLIGSIDALGGAVNVLAKHNGGASLLQTGADSVQRVAILISREMEKHKDLLQGVLSHTARRSVAEASQSPQGSSYSAASGPIFGILGQMKETFETNLASSQQEEQTNQKSYTELKNAKTREMAAGKKQVEAKTREQTETDEKLVNAKEDIQDTTTTLEADEKFLEMLKEKCALMDKEWEARQKERTLEMEACSKALAVLDGDKAHDLFTRTFNFMQVSARRAEDKQRARAASLLESVSNKLNRPRLAALATRVRIDAFNKVVKSIENMIEVLKKEQRDEMKHKDFCVDALNQNHLDTQTKSHVKADTTAKINDLEGVIKELTADIDSLNNQIAEMRTQMKKAGEDREEANKDFQLTVRDQRQTKQLLTAALKILEGFYEKKAAAMMQQDQPAGPAPPPGFKPYQKNRASGGVMGMIQKIIDDAKAMEAEAIQAEIDEQKAYEGLVKNTNAAVKAKQQEVVDKTDLRSGAEVDNVQAKEDLEAVTVELEQLANEERELHHSCDFLLKNFETREIARTEEQEALEEAVAILKGAAVR